MKELAYNKIDLHKVESFGLLKAELIIQTYYNRVFMNPRHEPSQAAQLEIDKK
jgi:hypothetical protein